MREMRAIATVCLSVCMSRACVLQRNAWTYRRRLTFCLGCRLLGPKERCITWGSRFLVAKGMGVGLGNSCPLWLFCRPKQRVMLGGQVSDWSEVFSGVP